MTSKPRSKPELLAPAGDFEKLQIAIAYGADAVYLGGTSFGLRAKAKNFDTDELRAAISYAHERNVKVYVTVNIFARNSDIDDMAGYFTTLAELGADAFIISDPGVVSLAKKEAPQVEIHISTQANTTNYASVRFWHEMGAKRVILARELSLKEIKGIRERVLEGSGGLDSRGLDSDGSGGIALEGFVHGAMCMSYSGRCMLSRYLSPDRDANLGACAHPCRYNYRLYAEEVSRPGRFMPVVEDELGTDIFGAEDLCMVAHVPEMIDAGLTSFKIEGRMKTAFYVALATKAYRQAIDDFFEKDGESKGDTESTESTENTENRYKKNIPKYLNMLEMASHRPFSTGFYFHEPGQTVAEFVDMAYTRSHDFVGIVRGYDEKEGWAVVEQRGVFEIGDTLTFIGLGAEGFSCEFSHTIEFMQTEDGKEITRAPHAQQRVMVKVGKPVEVFCVVCKANGQKG